MVTMKEITKLSDMKKGMHIIIKLRQPNARGIFFSVVERICSINYLNESHVSIILNDKKQRKVSYKFEIEEWEYFILDDEEISGYLL